MIISLEQIQALEQEYRRNLINCLSGFKSLNLVGTKSSKGSPNLALYSQVMHVGANPPLVGILSRPAVVPRHTLENIYETRQFTINQVHLEFYKKAHWTSARWDENEFEKVGLTEEYTEAGMAPYVKESRIKYLCEFKERHTIQTNQTTLVVGQIKELIVEDELVAADGFIDLEAAKSITVSGLDRYHTTQSLGRLGYAKPGEFPKTQSHKA